MTSTRLASPFPRLAATLWAALAAAAAVAGCHPGLPVYSPRDTPESLAIISARTETVSTVQSRAVVTLTNAQGERVRLDAALIAQPPGLFRLRAWKLSRAVFDATFRDGEVWLLPNDDADHTRSAEAHSIADGLRMAVALLGPRFYDSAKQAHPPTPRELVVVGEADGRPLTCVIDRPTLTPRTFSPAAQDSGEIRIHLGEFRMIGDVPWPQSWIISHPQGQVEINLSDVALNIDLPPGAFDPPARAIRSP